MNSKSGHIKDMKFTTDMFSKNNNAVVSSSRILNSGRGLNSARDVRGNTLIKHVQDAILDKSSDSSLDDPAAEEMMTANHSNKIFEPKMEHVNDSTYINSMPNSSKKH